jgi:hypothetical protein
MENIVEPTNNFDFTQLNLENPTPLHGGNFFTKINYTDKKLPLYIQMPKCRPKQGIVKNTTSKKSHIDLLYHYYDSDLISWFENLETRCRELIFNKKDIWFQTEMNLDDIENMFISCTKVYKSGKMIIIRAHIPYTKQIKKDYCMIYDENERVLDTVAVTDSVEIIPLICIDGIKFSSKSFQIDILLPQLMVLCIQNEIKNDFMIKQGRPNSSLSKSTILNNQEPLVELETNNDLEETEKEEKEDKDLEKEDKDLEKEEKDLEKEDKDLEDGSEKNQVDLLDLQEVHLNINNTDESISLKHPTAVYYEIYKAAREKAKHMRQVAVDAYLEARKIKSTYMLDDLEESEDNFSNLSEDEENTARL